MLEHQFDPVTCFCRNCSRSAEEVNAQRSPCKKRILTKRGRRINV